MIKNPDKYIRKAYIDELKLATGLPVYAKKIPKNVTPVPLKYILVSSQTKQRTAVTKQDWEWLTQITLDIVNTNELGYASPVQVDDVEEQVINAIEENIEPRILLGGFAVKSVDLLESQNLDLDTTTKSIERRILIYEHWVWQV